MATCMGLWYVYWYGLLFLLFGIVFNSFGYALIVAQNGQGSSVKRGRILHLTRSRGGGEGGLGREEKNLFHQAGRHAFLHPWW